MVKCSSCGSFNYDDARFCVNCGTRLPPTAVPVPRLSVQPKTGAARGGTPAGTSTHPAGQAPSIGLAPGVGVASTGAQPGTAGKSASSYTQGQQPATGVKAINAVFPRIGNVVVSTTTTTPSPARRPTLQGVAEPATSSSIRSPVKVASIGPTASERLEPGLRPAGSFARATPEASDFLPSKEAAAFAGELLSPDLGDSRLGATSGQRGGLSTATSVADALRRASEPLADSGALKVESSQSSSATRGALPIASSPIPDASNTELQDWTSSPSAGDFEDLTVVDDDFPMEEVFDESLDDLLEDLDAGFDQIVAAPGAGTGHDHTVGDLTEVRALFGQIAANHMQPVRDFVLELQLGDPSREWVDLVLPAVNSLRRSAEGMGIGDLASALDGFIVGLEATVASPSSIIGGETKQRLLVGYGTLITAMPEAFTLSGERDRREPVIVNSLLRQVPEVRKVSIDKLYAAGLTRLEMFYVAKPFDVAQAAGLSMSLAERIVERFQLYRQELAEQKPDHERVHEHTTLAKLARRLHDENEGYEAAAKSWTRQAAEDKKRLRKERGDTVLEINVLLARLGEVALVNELEKLPFQRKVEEIERWLEKARAARAQEARVFGTK